MYVNSKEGIVFGTCSSILCREFQHTIIVRVSFFKGASLKALMYNVNAGV